MNPFVFAGVLAMVATEVVDCAWSPVGALAQWNHWMQQEGRDSVPNDMEVCLMHRRICRFGELPVKGGYAVSLRVHREHLRVQQDSHSAQEWECR